MSETLSEILKFLVTVICAMLVLSWCAGCLFGFLWVAKQIPVDGMLQRAIHLVAALGGLAFSLWVMAKATKSRL